MTASKKLVPCKNFLAWFCSLSVKRVREQIRTLSALVTVLSPIATGRSSGCLLLRVADVQFYFFSASSKRSVISRNFSSGYFIGRSLPLDIAILPEVHASNCKVWDMLFFDNSTSGICDRQRWKILFGDARIGRSLAKINEFGIRCASCQMFSENPEGLATYSSYFRKFKVSWAALCRRCQRA